MKEKLDRSNICEYFAETGGCNFFVGYGNKDGKQPNLAKGSKSQNYFRFICTARDGYGGKITAEGIEKQQDCSGYEQRFKRQRIRLVL